MFPPVDSWVMGVEPIDPKDDGMSLELSNMEVQGFMVVFGDGDLERGLLGNRTGEAGIAICHMEADGLR